MKTVKLSIYALLIGSISLVSCGKDDDPEPKKEEPITEEPTTEDPKTENPVITAAVVSQQKADIEDNGLELITELDALTESQAMDVMDAFGSLTSESGPLLGVAANISSGANATTLKSSLKAEALSIAEEFAGATAIYTWNSTNQDWDSTGSETMVAFKFPSVEGGTTNDAELALTEVLTESNPLAEETGDAPTSIKAHLKVGTTTLMAYTMSASYNSEGVPTSLNTDLSIEDFVLSESLSNTGTKATETFSFVHGSKTILKTVLEVNGELTQAKVESLESAIETAESFAPIGEFVSSSTFSFQILDVKLSGSIDCAGIANSVTGEETPEEGIAIANEETDLSIGYANGTKIADLVFELDYEYDEAMLVFVFGDGSKVDAETYFEDSLTEFETEFEAFITDLESSL